MQHDHEVIVIGVGGMGSAALAALARRGVAACGIERFAIGHDRGSSHGRTRIIRKAYFEHPDYVPLLDRAYELWDELEASCGEELFRRCGFLTVGQPGGETIEGLEACYAAYDRPHERLAAAQVSERFPQFRLDPGMVGFHDPLGGYLRVEACVERHVEQARARGAVLLSETPVRSWRSTSDGVAVQTDGGEITAGALIVSTGAWLAPELARLGVATRVWRKVQLWFDAPAEGYGDDRLPTFYFETDGGHFYGFPDVEGRGVKVAEHVADTTIEDPDALDRDLRPDDPLPVLGFIRDHLPAVPREIAAHAVCMYTMTPDAHFIIDRHPLHPRVVLAGGFSGHGFKFAPAVGEVLADLAVRGETEHPIGFLGLNRFAV